MQSSEKLPGRTAIIDGEEWLYFSGTAYLGIVQNAAFQEMVREGIDRYGTHYGGSRLASVRSGIYEEAEAVLAEWTGAPAALIVSSGMTAGQLVLRVPADVNTNYFCAPGLHPTLWPPNQAPFAGSFEDWIAQVTERISQREHSGALLLSNALDAVRGRSYDFSPLGKLNPTHPVVLIVDDSHGLGITGNNGSGIYSKLPAAPGVERLVVSSLAKAFGIPGGVILGEEQRIEQLKAHPFFGGASPPPPAYLYALCRSEHLYRQARKQLRRNIHQFHRLTKDSGLFQSIDGHPVFYTPKNELADFLALHQVLVSSFRYPTPEDERVTRVVLNALHTDEDVERLGRLVRAF